jgi:hypothetical protein
LGRITCVWFYNYNNDSSYRDIRSQNFSSTVTFSQQLNTIPLGIYSLTFWIYASSSPSDPTATLTVRWEGNIIDTITNIPNTYTMYQYNVTSTVNNSILLFTSSRSISFTSLDDVSVIQMGGPCYHGDSSILTRNTLNDEIKTIKVSEVISGIHDVFSVNDKKLTHS